MKYLNRFALAAMAFGLMNAAESTESAGGAAPAPEAAPQKVGTVQRDPIINGRMPATVVYLVRHGNNKGEATKALAKLFGTTVGKIDDIKKGRNFAYVTEAFRPTEAMKAEAAEWLKRHPTYDAAGVDKVMTELDALPVATAEEAAAYEQARVAARGQLPTTKDGEPAAAGGGNRRAPRKSKKAEVQGGTAEEPKATADAGTTGDALLA